MWDFHCCDFGSIRAWHIGSGALANATFRSQTIAARRRKSEPDRRSTRERVRSPENRQAATPRHELFCHPTLEAMITLGSVTAVGMKKRNLEFSSHPGNLSLMRSFVRKFLDNLPIPERDRTLMVLGVDEACTNIIRHAYELREDQLIALSLEQRQDCVRMRLRDYGMQPRAKALRPRRDKVVRPGGLGLLMIRNAFDQVDYILRQRGTELVLTKKILFDGLKS
jgi:serine/threonine-protein kinase RsbW